MFRTEMLTFASSQNGEQLMTELPNPIGAYFAADRSDGDAVARCFTKDAVVKDEGRTYTGRESIKAWKAAVAAKFHYTSEPMTSRQEGGTTVVTSRLTGDFPD